MYWSASATLSTRSASRIVIMVRRGPAGGMGGLYGVARVIPSGRQRKRRDQSVTVAGHPQRQGPTGQPPPAFAAGGFPPQRNRTYPRRLARPLSGAQADALNDRDGWFADLP